MIGYTFRKKSGLILFIWVSFLSEIDLKVTKMAIKAKTCGKIVSKVVFPLVHMDIYYPLPFVSQMHFGLPTDISTPLWISLV